MANAIRKYSRYALIAILIILVLTAAFLFEKYWVKNQSVFNPDIENNVIEYKGDKYVLREGVETFLVLGLDTESAFSADSYNNDKRADFIMLFVLDNAKKTCSAIHINRDTMAKVNVLAIDGFNVVDTTTKQIALAHTYGNGKKTSCRNTADAVSELLLGVHMDHYMSLTMDSVLTLNNLVNGVEVTVLDDFKGIDDSLVKGKTILLSDEQALTYLRTRNGLSDSSNARRMERQQQYINALYGKISESVKQDNEFIIRMIDTIDEYIVYDSTDYRMKEFAEKFDDYEFTGIINIEGEQKLGEEYVEFYPDEKFLQKTVVDLFYEKKD